MNIYMIEKAKELMNTQSEVQAPPIVNTTTALAYYNKHLERMKAYVRNNAEANKARQKVYLEKLKMENPERHKELMERKKEISRAYYEKKKTEKKATEKKE